MKVCIEQTAEGFAVYEESQPDMVEMAGSAGEALEIAGTMLGAEEEQEESPMMEGEDQLSFEEGFKGARGSMEY